MGTIAFRLGVAVAAAAAFTLLATGARASLKQQSEDFDRKITAELAARDPDGADLFAKARQASDRNDLDGAATLYAQVRERDPWFLHATRRLCGIESMRKNRDRAVALCREAVGADASATNETALAMALLRSEGKPPPEDVREAYGRAQNAVRKDPDDAYAQLVLCQSAFAARELQAIDTCAARLEALDPDTMSTHYFAAIRHASHDRLDEAQADLDRAHTLGLSDDVYRLLADSFERSRSPVDRYSGIAWRSLLGWLGGFAVLLGLGAILSRLTLRAVARIPRDPGGHARGVDAALRRTYRVVLWLTCGYYYASLPIVALAVLGLGGGLIYLCFAIGQIPIKLVLIALLIIIYSLVAIARSLVVRSRDEDPGEPLDLGEHPRLRAVLDEVAGRVGTRPVDAVYVTPFTDIAVLERGGLLRQLRGKSQRCLVLGAGVLDGMRVRELKAILAHEYGHFQNEDTAGGGFALAVRRSILTMAMHLARKGVASPLNPAWWFVRGFHALFLRVSQGASRLQEVLADRWAAFAYGSDAFGRGLTHVVQRSIGFDAHMTATLEEAVKGKLPVGNVYAFAPKQAPNAKRIAESVEEAMNRASSPYDSHPRPADRIAWAEKVAAAAPPESADDASEAWTLFASREAIENRMTEVFRTRLARNGIELRREQAAASSPAA
jgi:Zn-dependent protease with chaperone function